MTDECNNEFSRCNSARNIKSTLQKYNKVISDKHDTSERSISNKLYEIVNNKLFNGDYSDTKLLNDFYHIKYNHHVNDNTDNFNSFCKYLSDDNNVLACDPQNCKGYTRYFRNRHQLLYESDHKHNDDGASSFSYKYLSRIHTYFIHAYETSTLSSNELAYINPHLMDVQHAINYKQIAQILYDNNIKIDANKLENACNQIGYHKDQLTDDICQALCNENYQNTPFAQMLSKYFNMNKPAEQQKIHHLLLYNYIDKKDISDINFIKILQYIAFQINANINTQEIAQIVTDQNLNINIFRKGKKEFKNSVKFAKLFKSMKGWNKKQFADIYVKMNKWQSYVPEKIERKKDNLKYMKENKMCDEDILNLFSALTKSSKSVSMKHLQDSNWNIDSAMDKYYSTFIYETPNDNEIDEKSAPIYCIGFPFWYWKPINPQHEQFYIEQKYVDLKQEILAAKLPTKQWNDLQTECKMLLKIDNIKNMLSNGKNTEVYNIETNQAISLQHLCSIKLYTDFTTLNSTFCGAFRLTKLTNDNYERIESLKTRNSQFAIWARLLIECVQIYGSLEKGKKYYRGVSHKFMFKRFIMRFYVPLSTTTATGNLSSDINRIAHFAGGGAGIIMEFKKYDDTVSGFDCSFASDFDREKETLFFGHDTILVMNSIFGMEKNIW
eukprot:219891_1